MAIIGSIARASMIWGSEPQQFLVYYSKGVMENLQITFNISETSIETTLYLCNLTTMILSFGKKYNHLIWLLLIIST